MKKSIISLLALLTVVLLPTSCTLFDDDYLSDKYEEETVPVHTGEGYDRIVDIEEGTSKVSYQLNSNVRQLTDAHEQYVLKLLMDSTNTYGYVQFLPSIPDDLRPRKGEIILSTGSEHFPDGIGHKVVMADYYNDTYTCVLVMVPLQSIFKYLDMDIDPFEQLEGATYEAPSATRADGDEQDLEGGWDWNFTIPFGEFFPEFTVEANNNKKGGTANVKVKLGGEFKEQIRIKVSMPNWWAPAIYVKEKSTSIVTLDISGSLGFSKTFTVSSDIIRKILHKTLKFVVGPVLLKVYMPFEIGVDADITAALHIKATSVSHSTIDINPSSLKDGESKTLRNTSKEKEADKITVEVLDGNGLLAHLSGSVSIKPTLGLCLGFYTKGLGAQAKMYFNLNLNTQPPSTPDGFNDYSNVFSTDKNPGLVFDPSLEWFLKVVLDLDFSKMFDEIIDDFDDEIHAALTAIENTVYNDKETQKLIQDERDKKLLEARDWVKRSYADTASEIVESEQENGNTKNFQWTWGPWTIFKFSDFGLDKRWTWAPRISFDKIYISPTDLVEDGKSLWWSNYFVSDTGLLNDKEGYYPYMYVTQVHSNGSEQFYGIFPERKKRKITSETKDDEAIFFYVPGLQNDTKYKFYGLFTINFIDTSDPYSAKIPTEGDVFMSKGVNYSYRIPKVEINGFSYFLTDWNDTGGGKYVYEIEIETKSTVSKVDGKLDAWGILGYVFDSKTNKMYEDPEWKKEWKAGKNQLKNGTFTQKWILKSTIKDLNVTFVPYVIVDGKTTLLENSAITEAININF